MVNSFAGSRLRRAGFQPDEAYIAWCQRIRISAISRANFEPPRAGRDCDMQQSSKSGAEPVPWQGGDKVAFLEEAKLLSWHPAGESSNALPQDLKDAIAFVCRKRESILGWRTARVRLLQDAERALRPLNATIVESMQPHVRAVAGAYNVAFIACVADAIEHPDVDIACHFIRGFPCLGSLPTSHVFPLDPKAAQPKPVEQVFNGKENTAWNARLAKSIRKRGLKAHAAAARGSPEQLDAAVAAWEATAKECAEGWILGKGKPTSAGDVRGFTELELDAHPWLGKGRWRATRRFAILQKGKYRPVDDWTENGLNDTIAPRDKLALEGADLLVGMAREYETHLGDPVPSGPDEPGWAFEAGTDDAKKAYRRIPARLISCMVVAVWDPVRRCVVYFIVLGFPFGAISAVYAWNRYPALVNGAARRLLAVPCGSFYDDFATGGASFERASGQEALGELASLFGIGFEDSKHDPMDQKQIFLGVESDFTRLPLTGTITVGVSASRKVSVAARVGEARAATSLTRAHASSLAGKCRFSLSPVFGRFGIAVLRPLIKRAASRDTALTAEIERSLAFLERALPLLPPVSVPLRPRRELPCVVLSDASFSRSKGGRVGVVVWCPRRQQLFHCEARPPPWMDAWLHRLERKATYICQFELVAALCAYLTFPDVLDGRQVHHFIDNRAAIAGLIGGYSGSEDSNAIIHAFYLLMGSSRARPWFSFVYSEDNISDLPSRGSFELVQRLGSQWRRCRLPSLAALAGW
jgi:hypothetical protein